MKINPSYNIEVTSLTSDQTDLRQYFKMFYLKHFKAVVLFCNSYVHDPKVAEDIVQDTFFKLWQQYDQETTEQNRVAFLYITAKNQCLDHLRHIKHHAFTVDELKDSLFSDQFFFDEFARQEIIRSVRQAVSQLTGRNQEITLLILQGKSNQEIADALRISINSVKFYKKDIYLKLRKYIDNEYALLVLLIFFC